MVSLEVVVAVVVVGVARVLCGSRAAILKQ